FRQYDAADPTNRLVAGELEARWNTALVRVADLESKIVAHETASPTPTIDPAALALLGANLKTVWSAPTTDARLKKPSVPTMLRQSPTGSLPLRAEVETSHGYAPYY
ncbi:MAG: hypothetical protein ACXW52_22750, partial [Candidatus Binatia bacterium]